MKKMINFFVGLLIVFAILYFCEALIKLLKISFPVPIAGIILFFILLKTNVIKENLIKDFCEFMLKYMILFFIPAFVGIIGYFDIISKNLFPILATIFISTTLTVAIVGLFVYHVIKYQRFFNMKKGVKK